ncbi:hypothetical protein FPQ18DRAFT_421255 [Pyronema domesticum]|nr:hypothetical protein FPQ18DRAFT_421255 [Pyronema domesticum]
MFPLFIDDDHTPSRGYPVFPLTSGYQLLPKHDHHRFNTDRKYREICHCQDVKKAIPVVKDAPQNILKKARQRLRETLQNTSQQQRQWPECIEKSIAITRIRHWKVQGRKRSALCWATYPPEHPEWGMECWSSWHREIRRRNGIAIESFRRILDPITSDAYEIWKSKVIPVADRDAGKLRKLRYITRQLQPHIPSPLKYPVDVDEITAIGVALDQIPVKDRPLLTRNRKGESGRGEAWERWRWAIIQAPQTDEICKIY